MRSIQGSTMKTDLQRLFDKFRRTPVPSPRPVTLAELQCMRNALHDAVRDCASTSSLRLQRRIARASTAGELCALRADAHDVIARFHCQTVAVQRIRGMKPLPQGCHP
ncbi:hypothetical protein [Hydrogenophaga sp. RWCD_12]|uniref:hypothetical protein n=1 Tax=Hydrogenophaga sp. RWCD_12 TaxID=3391190 RepID=UPI0039851949